MNKYIILLIGLLMFHVITPCPTCVGRLEHDSPSFFSDEFYSEQQSHESDVMRELNETDTERKDGS